MKSNLIGLDLSVLDVCLVSDQTNGGVGTHLVEIHIPFLDVSIGVSVAEIEHDDSTMGVNVIALSEVSELFLASGVPDVEPDLSVSGAEVYVSNDCSLGWVIGLLEVA